MFQLTEFDKIICLCVDHRLSQWDSLRAQFEDRGIEVETFLTGDGYLRPQEEYRLINDPFALNNAQKCYDGHRAILEKCKREKYNRVILLEDDVLLSANFDETLAKVESDMSGRPWDVFYYGANHSFGVTEEITPNLLRCRGTTYCCHMMAINNERLPMFDILLNLPYIPSVGPMDYWIAHNLQPDPSYYFWAAWPQIATQQAGLSVLNNCQMNYEDYFKSKGKPYEPTCLNPVK